MPDIIPWYYKALAGVILVGLVVGGADAYLDHVQSVADKTGYDRATGEWKAKEAGITIAADEKVAAANKRAAADTEALQNQFNLLADKRQKEKTDHENDKAAAVARALAGVERLRIATTPSTADALPAAGHGESAGPAGGSETASTADLLPETAAVILDVAGDYGQLVRDYNAVVDRYELIEHACNAGRATITASTTQGE